MRRVAIILVPFLVAGCALPPALTLASLAADGISYAATGKSTTDHAISAIADEDCALLRAAKEEAVCRPDGPKGPNGQVLISMAEPELSDEGFSDPGDSHDDSRGVFRPQDD